MEYILASGSPRRRELLKTALGHFKIFTADIDETVPCDIAPKNAPEYLALKKANFISKDNKDAVVIGADTIVLLQNEILGKPENAKEAKKMLKSLSGKTHLVITGCALVCGEKRKSFSVVTKVTFFELSDKEIDDYIAKGESFDKAGGYGIQGFGSLLVKKISGDYFNVVGLPVSYLARELKAFEKEISGGENIG